MDLTLEETAWQDDKLLCGVDEVGYGSIFHSCYIAGVIFPTGFDFSILPGLTDSKKLKDAKRFALEPIIKENALSWFCEEITAAIIDIETAFHAKYRVASEAINKIALEKPLIVVMDGSVKIPNLNTGIESTSLIKGDLLVKSISAASIIAKCTHRRKMMELANVFSNYDIVNNNGYGTSKHEAAIRQFGLTQHHRRTYCKKFIQ
jgi:ribonuclease HII